MGVRTYSAEPRIYLDMDGVVADFDAEAAIRGIAPKELKAIYGVYKKLPLMEGASEGIFNLLTMRWEIFLLTKIPRENPSAASDKITWVNEWLPMIGERVIITPDKGCVGRPEDFLVDDHPEWANSMGFRGTLIQFGKKSQPVGDLLRLETWEELVNHFRMVLAVRRQLARQPIK